MTESLPRLVAGCGSRPPVSSRDAAPMQTTPRPVRQLKGTRAGRSRTMMDDVAMADTRSSEDDLLGVPNRLIGETVAELQILGINSLKSVTPSPLDLAGLKITEVSVTGRTLDIRMGAHAATVDLERTGRLVWLDNAQPAQVGSRALPTARLLLRSGAGLDFTEPAKTKRITVTLRAV